MARQMVAGKRFFLDEFGVETQDVWLPDSFGYSGALPQIVRSAGLALVPLAEAVLERHRPDAAPHLHLGGHRRLPGAHALPAGRHVQLRPVRARAAARRGELRGEGRRRRPRSSRSAGATAAAARRARCSPRRAGSRSLEGAPTVELGSPNTFFARAEAEFAEPSVWTGEMYLEFHRGTYTSQARTKQGNRRSEHLLREAELWAATAAVQRRSRLPVRRARAAVADRAAAPVPRHPARQLDRLGAPRRRRRRTPRSAPSSRTLIAAAVGRSVVGDGDAPRAAQRRAARPRPGCRPWAPARSRPTAGDPVDLLARGRRHRPRPQRPDRRAPRPPAARSTRCATWSPTAR